jgi:hypothetical protein
LSEQFDADVDAWVLAAVRSAPTSFDDLVCHLPGIYPTEVIAALVRLQERGVISAQEGEALSARRMTPRGAPVVDPRLPVPHPLDFDWRFSPEASELLLGLSSRAERGQLICIGAPSVARAAASHGRPDAVLVDANPRVVSAVAEGAGAGPAVLCRVGVDPLPDLVGTTVVIDPPWYVEHFRVFLWAASAMAADGATILVSFPAPGTRPGIVAERSAVMSYAARVGLQLVDIRRGALSYVSPPFEQRALSAAGVEGLPLTWRRGDLMSFEAVSGRWVGECPVVTPELDDWSDVPVSGTRIKMRRSSGPVGGPIDPRLVSLVPGDVLPTVSRRDVRRRAVMVWTATNRVFGCNDVAVLASLADASSSGDAPTSAAEEVVRRTLSPDEVRRVAEAVDQLQDLIEVERRDLTALGWL